MVLVPWARPGQTQSDRSRVGDASALMIKPRGAPPGQVGVDDPWLGFRAPAASDNADIVVTKIVTGPTGILSINHG